VKRVFFPLLGVFLFLDLLDSCLLFSAVNGWNFEEMKWNFTGKLSRHVY